MRINHLSLTQFRNFARLDVDLPAGPLLLVGNNAQGKTSILEAIYYLATVSSFHATADRQLINFLEARQPLAVARIVADFHRAGRDHRLEVRIIQEHTKNGVVRARKELLLNGARKKVSEVLGHFNAVLFLPQMLRVVDGPPSERRRYLDLALSQVLPHYAENLAEYNKVLGQRNALLKQLAELGGDSSQLDFWDERLVLRGARIILDRIHAIQQLDQLAARTHHRLTRAEEVLRLAYRPSYDPSPPPANQMTLIDAPVDRTAVTLEKIESGFRQALAQQRDEHVKRGATTIGPHRDELRFLSNSIDLGIYGSRGQVRTTLLTIKLAELDWMKDKTGHWPILLLDEVLAELDLERRADLLARLTDGQQALLTTTDLNLFEPAFIEKTQVWRVHAGRIEAG